MCIISTASEETFIEVGMFIMYVCDFKKHSMNVFDICMTHSSLLLYVRYTIIWSSYIRDFPRTMEQKAEETDYFLPPNNIISTYA